MIHYYFFMLFMTPFFIFSMHDRYQIIPELIAHHVTIMEHSTVCELSLVNHTLNTIIHNGTEQRKKYLESYVLEQPTIMQSDDQYVAWHALGSACAFVTATDTLESSYSYDTHVCRFQLGCNDTVIKYIYYIMKCACFPLIGKYGLKKSYRVEACISDTLHDGVRINFPIFNQYGTACIYYYLVYTKRNMPFIELSITNDGIKNMYKCNFEFQAKGYSLCLLKETQFLPPFINSSHVQINGDVKTFMSDGVKINNMPLTKGDEKIIEDIIDPKNIQRILCDHNGRDKL